MLKGILLLLVPVSMFGVEMAEGPFKSTGPGRNAERDEPDGITLMYHASRRASNQWLDAVRADGSTIRLCVDVGLVGHGVEAYLSLGYDVVVLDAKTRATLWMNPVGAWYHTLCFQQAKDAATGQEMTLLEVGGTGGPARYLELRTGQEKFVEIKGGTLIARAQANRELRGKPIRVLKSLTGADSKATTRRCERIISESAWRELWKVTGRTDRPDIDFSREMAVGIFLGETWNCKGLEVTHALDCEGAVELFLRRDDYQTMGKADRSCPYGIFILPKSPKELIVKADSQGYIGGPPLWVKLAEFSSDGETPQPGRR